MTTPRTSKAAIFDLDGTLLDTLDSLTEACRRTLAVFDLPPFSRENVKTFVGKGAHALVERMMRTAGITSEKIIERAYAVYLKEFDQVCTHGVVPYPGVPEMLLRLKNAGIRMAVVTNKGDDVASRVLSGALPDGLFSRVIGGREGRPLKPDPTVTLEVLREFGCSPAESFFIGDTFVDVRTGRAAGMTTIAVLWGYAVGGELDRDPPDYLASHADDIVHLIL